MDIREAIRSRRSIRRFKDDPVSRKVVEELLDLANWAPSNCNIQSWRFIVVDDAELKQKIVDHGGNTIIKSAPLGILVCYDHRSVNIEYKDWLQSAAAATQNILLGATSLGLGSCWICHLPSTRTLRKVFKIPPFFTPTAYLALGYPLDNPKMVDRLLATRSIYEYNCFPLISIKHYPRIFLFLKMMAVRCHYLLPLFIKKKINSIIDHAFIKKYTN